MEVVVKEIDSLGRVYIPAKWRKDWHKVLLVRLDDGAILMKPIRRRMKFTDLFDSIEVDVGPNEFLDYHRLRLRLRGELH